MHQKYSRMAAAIVWGVLLGGAVATAQSLSISGTVTDEKKALVPDVEVALRDPAGKPSSQKSDASGVFKFEGLRSGQYEISFSKKDYDSSSRTLTLTNESRTVDVALGLGRISTTLTVTDSADFNPATRLYVPDIEVPVQTSVISQQTLRDQNINDLLTALENVSGVTTQKQYGSMEWYTVGGFTQQSGNEFLYVDGMASPGNRSNTQLTNIESIEVIKGPAALLGGTAGSGGQGSGAAGGIVNVTRKKPQAQPFQEFYYRVGRWGQNEFYGASTGNVFGINQLRYRVDTGYAHTDGFRNAGGNRFNLSPVLEYLINDNGRIIVQQSFSRDRFTEDAGIPAALYVKTGFPIDRKFNPPGDYDRYHDWQNQVRFEYNLGHNIRLQDQFFHEKKFTNYLESEGLNYSASAFTLARTDSFSMRHLRPTQNIATLTGTHRFLGINHNWAANYNLQDHYSWNDRTGATPNSTVGTFPILPALDLNQWLAPGFTENPAQQTSFPLSRKDYTALSYSIYSVQDHIELTRHFSFNFVLSNATAKRRAHNDSWDPATSTFLTRGAETSVPTQHAFNYRAGLTYLVKSNFSVYGMSSTNFSPLTSIPSNLDPNISLTDLKSPTNRTYVAGWKWNSRGGRLKADFNAGKVIAQNMLITVVSPITNTSIVVQAGQQSSKTADFDLEGDLGWGVRAIAVYGYAACRFDNFSTAVTGTNSNFTGRRCQYSNRHSGRSYLTKQIRIGNDKRMSFSLGATYRSKTVMTTNATQDQSYQGGWVRFDAGASFEVTRKWSASVNIQNLLNRQRFVVSQINGGGSLYPGAPFAATFTLRYQFNHD